MFSKHQRYFFLVSIFCWMICNWELFDIQNSRENRSKNQYKLVYENGHAVTCVQGSVRSWLWALESLSAFGKHSVTFVDSTFLRANLRWPTTVTAKPKTSRQKQNTSRQNQKPHGKNKIPHGKTENLKAKTKTSRQNRKPHGKKTKTSRQNRKFCLFCFRREVFGFAVRYFVFAVTVVGHHTNQILILKYDFWADIKLIVWSCALYL